MVDQRLETWTIHARINHYLLNPHPAAFLGHLIAHESHHRGEIELILTQAGHKLDQKTAYGLREWGVR